jgi:tetratricopeptide (TPR) repeat protein
MKRMGGFIRTLRAMGVVLLAFGATQATAQDVEGAIRAAIADAEQGRCDEAYRRLSSIEGLESRARFLAGRCRVQQGLYPEALADLDRARAAGGESSELQGDIELYRGIALYHLERTTEASAALDAADGRTREEAQLALYHGMIALQRGQTDRAAPLLESAGRLSPAGTEPVASFYAGMAWRGESERAKAREAFQRVVDLDPDGPWGKEALRMLESTELYPAYARVTTGLEYDDNVVLRGSGTDLLPSRDGDKDGRAVWSAEAGVQLFDVDEWSGGLLGSYAGSAHFDQADFDTHYPTIGGWVDRVLGRDTRARLRYDFGHAWVDDSAFLRSHFLQGGLFHTWEKAGWTDVTTDFVANDYRFNLFDVRDGSGLPGSGCPTVNGVTGCGPPGLDEGRERDRDGVGWGLGLEHFYSLPITEAASDFFEQVVARGGYRLGYYDSQGREWTHWSHRLSVGLEFDLPLDFLFDASFAYEHRDFANPSTFPDSEVPDEEYGLSSVDREEDALFVMTELEKFFGEHFSVIGRWSYIDNDSNRSVYDYDRHIVGGYVSYRFD